MLVCCAEVARGGTGEGDRTEEDFAASLVTSSEDLTDTAAEGAPRKTSVNGFPVTGGDDSTLPAEEVELVERLGFITLAIGLTAGPLAGESGSEMVVSGCCCF